ncbi:MAG TPA: 50S ribosomal protein L25 [bacterium]|nr:50S ribosomal protein L25 [bacterium]
MKAKVRDIRGSADCRRLRAKGFVPAEVYGHKEPNLTIEVNEKELSKILTSNRGENIFFQLEVEGAQGGSQLAILKEVQNHKLKNLIIHADFLKVKMDEKIRIRIPVRILNGETCEGVKAGGVLQLFLRSVEVQCLPAQIPEAVTVDALHLAIGSSVHVSDLKLAEGVKAITSGDSVVLSVAQQMAEEVKAATPDAAAAAAAPGAAPAAGAEPEVLTAKKKEEGAAAAPDAKGGEKKAAEKK